MPRPSLRSGRATHDGLGWGSLPTPFPMVSACHPLGITTPISLARCDPFRSTQDSGPRTNEHWIIPAGWHSLLQAVCAASETWKRHPKQNQPVTRRTTSIPSFQCLRHTGSLNLCHPQPRKAGSRLPLFLPQSGNRWSPWVSTHGCRTTTPRFVAERRLNPSTVAPRRDHHETQPRPWVETHGYHQRSLRDQTQGGTACFKLCAQHWKHGKDIQKESARNLENHVDPKFPMPSAHRFFEPVPPSTPSARISRLQPTPHLPPA